MRCPTCKEINKDRVIDSRLTDGGKAIRRRRECTACGRRYTTKERVEDESRLTVIKKDGSRMPFDAQKILQGMRSACYKRPVPQEVLQEICDDLQDELVREFEREVPSQVIGARVARRLRDVDPVAYVRFASVYREFKDLDDMIDEIAQVKVAADGRDPDQKVLFE